MKTRDKRRDSGEYYPGGRVIARPGTAPQQVVVQWTDVQGKPQIAPLPERYREGDMKSKINEITSKFAMALTVALIGWSGCAGITVQKARKGELWNDQEVVTNVIESGGSVVDTNAVERIANEAVRTNKVTVALAAATNDLTEAVAAIPRIEESEFNPGHAANADMADVAIWALYAGEANLANCVGTYGQEQIGEIEGNAANALAKATTNAAAIASQSSQLTQLSQSVADHTNATDNPHEVTAEQVGADAAGAAMTAYRDATNYTDKAIAEIELLPGPPGPQGPTGPVGPQGPKGDDGEVDPAMLDEAITTNALVASHSSQLSQLSQAVADHTNATNNPHEVTAEQVGALPVRKSYLDNYMIDGNKALFVRARKHDPVSGHDLDEYARLYSDGLMLNNDDDVFDVGTFYRNGEIAIGIYGRDVFEPFYVIGIPFRSGTMALLSDIPSPPGDYAAVSNAAMNSVQLVADANGDLTAVTIGSRPTLDGVSDWSQTSAYRQNVLVKKNDIIYICVVDSQSTVAAGAWDQQAEYWREVKVGPNSLVSGVGCVAGTDGGAYNDAAHAEGYMTHAEGYMSHAEGSNTHAEGYYSHAEGGYTHAEGGYGHAEGYYTHSSNYFNHAEGGYSLANGSYAHAEGFHTHSDGTATHAEGYYTHASEVASHAEGVKAESTNCTSFVWQGTDQYNAASKSININSVQSYGSHGHGTFNLNPVGGLNGLWIGETNLNDHIDSKLDSVVGQISAVLDAILGGH